MKQASLKDILMKDAANAKQAPGFENKILAAGEHVGKLIGFTEEDTYNYVTMEVDGSRYNLFYNYYIKDTTDLNADVINWIKALATIQVNENTSLLEIANSAIGSSYKFTIYNYTPKSGKNQGKPQHAISFRDEPTIETQTIGINEEEIELPY